MTEEIAPHLDSDEVQRVFLNKITGQLNGIGERISLLVRELDQAQMFADSARLDTIDAMLTKARLHLLCRIK